jgi:protein arginine kinase activator
MMCQDCNQKDATVHITKIVNGEKKEMHLCEDCASEYQKQWTTVFDPSFSLNKFLANLLNYEAFEKNTTPLNPAPRCSICGQSYQDFTQGGKLGCANCYKIFGYHLTPLLRRVHGSQKHKGKIPARSGGVLILKKEIQDLKQQLAEAIQKEEFEDAAKLRDQVRNLEKQMIEK